MADEFKHISLGFRTACGKGIHFTGNVVPIAATVSEVTCPECMATDHYKNSLEALTRELAAIKQREDRQVERVARARADKGGRG